MFNKTFTFDNIHKILVGNMVFWISASIAIGILFHHSPRVTSILFGIAVGWAISTIGIIWQISGLNLKSLLGTFLAYPLCVFCSFFVIYTSSTSVIYSTEDASQQRIGTGLTLVGLSENIEDYRIPWRLEGKTLYVRTSLDTTKILDIHREYQTNKAYNEAIRAQVTPLLDVPIPTVNKSLSVACQICSMEPFMDSLKQRVDDLHIPGLVVKKFDLSYFF